MSKKSKTTPAARHKYPAKRRRTTPLEKDCSGNFELLRPLVSEVIVLKAVCAFSSHLHGLRSPVGYGSAFQWRLRCQHTRRYTANTRAGILFFGLSKLVAMRLRVPWRVKTQHIAHSHSGDAFLTVLELALRLRALREIHADAPYQFNANGRGDSRTRMKTLVNCRNSRRFKAIASHGPQFAN